MILSFAAPISLEGRGLQVSQDTEDSHVTLTPVHSDGQQESMESIFTTGSSSITPIPSPKSTMTPSIMTTTTTASQPPIPPTPIPSDILQTLPTFTSVFRFEDRVKSLEVNFSEFMRTNQSTEAVSNIRGNKSIQRSDEQRNLNKALVEAYDADKTILDSYGESAILMIRRKDDDDQEGPSAGSDWGSTTGTQSRQMSTSESAFAEEPVQTTSVQENAQSWISVLAKQTDARSSFNKLLDTPIDFFNFIMNRLSVDTLTPKLLAGPTYELMRGSCNSLTELECHLEEFYGFAVNQESTLDVYSKRRIIAVTDLKIVEWHNYKHLDWILVRRDDDKIHKFKEGDFKRLRLQDIEDMLLLIIQGKLSNLTVEERVESYQKRLNLTKANTYRSDLKRREAYAAYSNPRGFIYQNKDKKNRLMQIDELQKFSDGMLNDVCNALDDRLKGIRMQYLPTTIWRKWDKDRAAAMI
nr:hypothetical protein [Tanacetum cinerariifolium]